MKLKIQGGKTDFSLIGYIKKFICSPDIVEDITPDIEREFKDSITRKTLIQDMYERIQKLERTLTLKGGLEKIEHIDPHNKHNYIPANNVLVSAVNELHYVHIMGLKKDGTFYFASNDRDKGNILYAIENFKKTILDL